MLQSEGSDFISQNLTPLPRVHYVIDIRTNHQSQKSRLHCFSLFFYQEFRTRAYTRIPGQLRVWNGKVNQQKVRAKI